ncbi:MAG: bifunctional phosphoribosylaminoimidazolecarboxamide formyltransferase/IMP cyclohydrolase [Candidatus Eisenbacteria bacterium]
MTEDTSIRFTSAGAGTISVRRVFASVHDKTGLAEFGKFLTDRGIEIFATGGTASFLKENGIPVTKGEDLTGFGEILSGKVKSLSPRLHASILFDRASQTEAEQVRSQGLLPVDMVVVNFYPFERVPQDAPLAEALSMIDIGGPASLRAAAKNFRSVVPVPHPSVYGKVMEDIIANSAIDRTPDGSRFPTGGPAAVSLSLSQELAIRVYETTASYDAAVSAGLGRRLGQEGRGVSVPERLCLVYRKASGLRYGENPHQAAGFYLPLRGGTGEALPFEQAQGKELSFNNLLDLAAAVCTCRELVAPGCVIIKHKTPCGVAETESPLAAFRLARDCDPLSAFGGIVAVNRELTEDVAREMSGIFLEAVAAPGFTAGAMAFLSKKKNLRLLRLPPEAFRKPETPGRQLRSGPGGLLLQEEDSHPETYGEWRVVSKTQPSDEQTRGLFFLWKVARHAVSNAVVVGRGDATLGIGCGQTSRVDAVHMAVYKAGRAQHDLRGALLASDGFFPFRDSVDAAAAAGIAAVVQPGGSIRDRECIEAADEHGMVMCLTGRRCFRH